MREAKNHYYSIHPKARFKLIKLEAEIRGFHITLYAAPGVFSAYRIDPGSRLLAENMIIGEDWVVLDLGTGYGILGIVAALIAIRGRVVMTDINKRALKLAKLNAEVNGVADRVDVRWGDLYEPVKGEKFNTIICNPPQSAGLNICLRIIREAPIYLKDGGLLQIVARHSKGGKRLMAYMKETFGNVRILASKGGYRVYCSEK